MFDINEFDFNVFEGVDEFMAQLQLSCIQDEVWLSVGLVIKGTRYDRFINTKKQGRAWHLAG